MPWSQTQILPISKEEIFSYLFQEKQLIKVGRADQVSSLASRAKEMLDMNFHQDIHIQLIASELGCSLAQLSKVFRRSYGISPVQYRSQLRVFDGMRELLFHTDQVTEVGLESGFQDLSRFNKQFKKKMLVRPSDFRARRD